MAEEKQDFSKYRNQIVIVVVVLLSILVARNLYKRHLGAFNDLLEKKRIEKEKAELIDGVIVLNEQLKQFKKMSWNTTDVDKILGVVSKLGTGAKIKILQLMPESKREEDYYVAIPFRIVCEATYKNLVEFLMVIEKYPGFVRVVSMDVSTITGIWNMNYQQRKRDAMLAVNMALEVFYFK